MIEPCYIEKQDYEKIMSQGKKEDIERLLEYSLILFEKEKKAKGNIKILNEYTTAYNPNIKEEDIKNPKIAKVFGKFFNKVDLAKDFLKVQPLYYDENEIWWCWDIKNLKWIRLDDTGILNLIRNNTEENTIKSIEKSEILEALRQVSREKKPEKPKESWVQFRNRIINIESGEEIMASEKYFISNPINWELGNSEETPVLDKLFISWVGEEHREELYEILAFCIVPSYFIHRLFCLIGSGSNGKSTYLKILERFIGEENITSSSLNMLLKERFEGSKLFKKLVCLMGETNFNLITNTDFLKKTVGEDMIRCEFKRKDGFDFRNYSKIIMATNSLPPTADKTEGFYRRWKIIEFIGKFATEKDVLSEITEEEYKNLALKSLNIAKRLWKERIFLNDGDFEVRKARYEEKSNPLGKYIKENYNRNISEEVIFQEFYEDFKIYLEERGFRELSVIATSKQLKIEGFEIKTLTKNNINAKYIIGLESKKLPILPKLPIIDLNTRICKTSQDMDNMVELGNFEEPVSSISILEKEKKEFQKEMDSYCF